MSIPWGEHKGEEWEGGLPGWPGLAVQMQSKQRLQVPTDDSGGQLETLWQAQELFEDEEMKSHQRLFNQTLMGLFMIVFFSVHRHAKGETGNPF